VGFYYYTNRSLPETAARNEYQYKEERAPSEEKAARLKCNISDTIRGSTFLATF